MPVTTDQLINRGDCRYTEQPVAASTVLYGGTLVFTNSGGFADDDIAAGANTFAGIVTRRYDNSGGANGDITAQIENRGQFVLTGSGFTQADVNVKVYATDNYTLTKTSTNNVFVGVIREVISATQVKVEIKKVDA